MGSQGHESWLDDYGYANSREEEIYAYVHKKEIELREEAPDSEPCVLTPELAWCG